MILPAYIGTPAIRRFDQLISFLDEGLSPQLVDVLCFGNLCEMEVDDLRWQVMNHLLRRGHNSLDWSPNL